MNVLNIYNKEKQINITKYTLTRIKYYSELLTKIIKTLKSINEETLLVHIEKITQKQQELLTLSNRLYDNYQILTSNTSQLSTTKEESLELITQLDWIFVDLDKIIFQEYINYLPIENPSEIKEDTELQKPKITILENGVKTQRVLKRLKL